MPDDTDAPLARNAALAATLLFLTLAFGWLVDAESRSAWLVGGAVATGAAEVLAYRRPQAVRSAFDRPVASAVVAAVAGVSIGIGAIVVPDRSLSLAAGALAAYLGLLGVVAVTGWQPGGSAPRTRNE